LMDAVGRRVILFDGGMGSMLISRGLREGDVPESWNFSRGDDLIEIHRAYLESGAEVIQANTFGANRIKLSSSRQGSGIDVGEANERAVGLARRALEEHGEPDRFLAGDIGPTGMFFEPVGKLEAKDARDAFREQASALERAGVDLFLIETMYDLREAVEALGAVRDVSDKPVVVELTFEKKPRGYYTMFGDTPRKGAEVLLENGADMIGANCTVSSADMIGLAVEFRGFTEAPLIFQPNAGRPEMEGGSAVYRQTPEEFVADMAGIVNAGADAVGGCCGTTPEFISELHGYLAGDR